MIGTLANRDHRTAGVSTAIKAAAPVVSAPPGVAAFGLLTRSPHGNLIAANALTALASGVQQLIQGWQIISWGGSPLYLVAFAAARLIPKAVLTLPAGMVCDRYSRVHVLTGSRTLNVAVSLLPLLGFVAPGALAWLIVAIALGGAIHAFDLPSGRALVGDIPSAEELPSVVALNNGGSHLAALIGPPLAYLLGPFGLAVSSVLFAIAAVLTFAMDSPVPHCKATNGSSGLGELVEYIKTAPAVTALLGLTLAPGVVDKLVLLLLPSISRHGGATGVALLAPEAGALLAAAILAVLPWRIGLTGIFLLAGAYSILLGAALHFAYQPELLVAGLGLAGVTKLAFNTTSQVRIQEAVPGGLRGRVLTF